MRSWWRGLALMVFLLSAWAGCSGSSKNEQDAAGKGPAAGKGTGQSGNAGKAGRAAGSGGTGLGAGNSAGEAGQAEQSAGSGGVGGSAPVAGYGGFAGSGTAALGGLGGLGAAPTGGAGTGPVAGTGGALAVPVGWTCRNTAYGDGQCDCGCGAFDDLDCTKNDLKHCEICNTNGGCNVTVCPGQIKASDPTHCDPLPSEWTCGAFTYADSSYCDCGCGVPDPDCKGSGIDSCDSCDTFGSCGNGACPSDIAPDDNSLCSIPDHWLCESWYYGDGYCHCGCGVVDIDCPSASPSACQSCPFSSCTPYYCDAGRLDPDDNSLCGVPPPSWSCPSRFYRDGATCDCGCGAYDPDCDSKSLADCERCDANGSCSDDACPGTVDPDSTTTCVRVPPPDTWRCGDYAYRDGYCDCGCGALDPDCDGTTDPSECLRCGVCRDGDCPASVNPADTTQCKPPPAGWTCNANVWGDGYCDCGCGVKDADCYAASSGYCNRCPEEGCSAGHCKLISAADNRTCTTGVPSAWSCPRGFFGDGACDCGCAARDVDCKTAVRTECDFCDDEGSCSTTPCLGTIDPSNNAVCSGG